MSKTHIKLTKYEQRDGAKWDCQKVWRDRTYFNMRKCDLFLINEQERELIDEECEVDKNVAGN